MPEPSPGGRTASRGSDIRSPQRGRPKGRLFLFLEPDPDRGDDQLEEADQDVTKAPPERERPAAHEARRARLQRPSEGWESGPDKFSAEDEDDDLDQQPYMN